MFILLQQWYVVSKTLAEEATWKFARDNGVEIITINPAMVIGPLLQPTLNTSAEAILKLINGMWLEQPISSLVFKVEKLAPTSIYGFVICLRKYLEDEVGHLCLVQILHSNKLMEFIGQSKYT
jgi:hypothetical protein